MLSETIGWRENTPKDKRKWIICKYFSHSFQRVSFVFVLTDSLSTRMFDISKMAYFVGLPCRQRVIMRRNCEKLSSHT